MDSNLTLFVAAGLVLFCSIVSFCTGDWIGGIVELLTAGLLVSSVFVKKK